MMDGIAQRELRDAITSISQAIDRLTKSINRKPTMTSVPSRDPTEPCLTEGTCFTSAFPMGSEVFFRQPQEGCDPSIKSTHTKGRIFAITFREDGGQGYHIRLGNGDTHVAQSNELDSDST